MSHWAKTLIDKSWHPVGDGVNSFNCWTFVQHVQRLAYGREMPDVSCDAENNLAIARTCLIEAAETRWRRVDRPADGDCVLLARGNHPCHVGVWVTAGADSGVLHCCKGIGVCYQSLGSLKSSGWGNFSYYRWIG